MNQNQNLRKLTPGEQKQLYALIQKSKGNNAVTVQQSIPYVRMYPDGTCHLRDNLYSRSIRFEELNYQLAGEEDQREIFERWCSFLNYFDASVSVQLTFTPRYTGAEDAKAVTRIPLKQDYLRSVRDEYAAMLKAQSEQANSGGIKEKYLTYTIRAEHPTAAKTRLFRMEAELLENFKTLGVTAYPMTGYERLELLHGILHPVKEPFWLSWEYLAASGLSSKDVIAPSSFTFRENRLFQIGETYGAVNFLQITAPELSDTLLSDLMGCADDSRLILNLHIRSMNQAEAVKAVKRKITDLDKMKLEEQKKAVRAGYDTDILPTDLTTYGAEAKHLLEKLQNKNERMFLLTFLTVNFAATREQLENDIFALSGIAQMHNCILTRLDYQQEAGFISSLPLGENQIAIERCMTTSSTAILMPFTVPELSGGKNALYYGLNALNKNMIFCDRTVLKNPNGIILGTPGSGKSFAAKREIANLFLVTDDDILICDPESEYVPLTNALHGQVIRLSPNAGQHINPLDINLPCSADDNVLALKSDFILSLCELVIGHGDGLKPTEKAAIDRAVRTIYRPYFRDPVPENMPILHNLYEALLRESGEDAKTLASALELYVNGSLNLFNHRTDMELNNRLVCFDIKQLGSQIKAFGMLVIQDFVWNRVTRNRAACKTTRYYMDEFHLLLKEKQTAAYCVEIWKRFRKWGGVPTAVTQNVKDLLSGHDVQNILENSDFILMLNQAAGDGEILANQLKLSPQQMKFITGAEAGTGLLFFGNTVLPFEDHFPKDTQLYRILTTKPGENGIRSDWC